ncbi:MAG: exosortase K [Chitinophagales bacterium]|nr:exosortase K [Chitinophagales bacterium]
MPTNNLLYYFLTVGVFILLKLGYINANNDQLLFLLQPVNKLIELLMASQAVYSPEKGYYHPDLNITFDKSCSGYNFWALSFLIFSYLMLQYIEKPWQKLLNTVFVLFATYLFTIFVNTSRIIAALVAQEQAKYFLLPHHHSLLHTAIGIITNLSFLIVAYYMFEKLLKQFYYHGEST